MNRRTKATLLQDIIRQDTSIKEERPLDCGTYPIRNSQKEPFYNSYEWYSAAFISKPNRDYAYANYKNKSGTYEKADRL